MIDFNDSMKDLADFINNNDLLDMEMDGVKFTWSNNKKGVDLFQVKLDRLLVQQGGKDSWCIISQAIAL